MVASLLEHERIETTVAKAKEVRKIAEKVITLGIKGDLAAKRLALSYVPNRTVVARLFKEIAPRFTGRNGGYLRVIHSRQRVNDSAPMAVLEFVDYEELQKTRVKTKEAKAERKESEKKS